MKQQSGRKRPFSETLDIMTQEENAKQPSIMKSESPNSGPSKIPRVAERSSSTSTEKTSNSSSYRSNSEHQWVRCAYFTRVHTVKGVAIEWQTKTTFAPVGKTPRVFEAELSEESTIGSPPTLTNTESLLSSLELFQEEPEAHTPEPAFQVEDEERPRAATPDWLITRESGFRCMACCRVFPSREAVLAHAKHGVKEGFSCRVFYEEMLERQRPRSEQRHCRRCHQLAQRCLKAKMKREIKEKEEICHRLEEKLKMEKHKLIRLQQKLMKLQRQETWQKKQRATHPQGQRGKRLKTRHRKTP